MLAIILINKQNDIETDVSLFHLMPSNLTLVTLHQAPRNPHELLSISVKVSHDLMILKQNCRYENT